MAREKHWPKVGPLSFTANGTNEGEIKLADTCGLFVKQQIILKSDTTERTDLEIKRVLDDKTIKVGRRGHKIDDFTDITAFTTADNAVIWAPEQSKRRIPPEDIEQARWMREPINADRTADIDCYGDIYTRKNPKPVSSGLTEEDRLKCAIMGAADVVKDYTWAEIDGVRRVTQIVWTSASVDALFGATHEVTRDFTYDNADPFDLDKTEDTLTVS